MKTPTRTVIRALVLATVLSLAACSGADPQARPAKGRPDGHDAPKAEDSIDLLGDPQAKPPLAFEPEAAHTIPAGAVDPPPIAFFGKAAWFVNEGGMTVLDLTTGEQVARIEPENPALYEATALQDMPKNQDEIAYLTPPQLARIEGEPAVLATIPVQLGQEKKGREKKGESAREGVEMIAVRARDGEVIWRLPIQLYGDLGESMHASVWRAPYQGTAAVQWSTSGAGGTFVVDLNEPRMLWQRTDFWITDAYQDTLVGFRTNSDGYYSVAGVELDTGIETWAQPMNSEMSVGSRPDTGRGGGPWSMVEKDGNGQLMEIATGETAFTEDDGIRASGKEHTWCELGTGGSVLLCASEADGALALDADSEKVLWKQPAGDGPEAWSGTVSEVHQDLAYVERGDELAVVDARTGETVRTGAGIVPDWVTPYAGMTRTDEGIEVHLPK